MNSKLNEELETLRSLLEGEPPVPGAIKVGDNMWIDPDERADGELWLRMIKDLENAKPAKPKKARAQSVPGKGRSAPVGAVSPRDDGRYWVKRASGKWTPETEAETDARVREFLKANPDAATKYPQIYARWVKR